MDGEGTYPEYDEMRKVFKENYDLFLEYLGEMGLSEPVPTECQFSYVNHFLEGKEWKTATDLEKIFPSICLPEAKGPEEIKNYDLNYVYNLPDENKGIFRMKISTAKVVSSGMKVIIFENGARGIDSGSDDIYEWFDYAHEQLVNKFEIITDKDLQKNTWKKQ